MAGRDYGNPGNERGWRRYCLADGQHSPFQLFIFTKEPVDSMGVFRFENKYAGPTKTQRKRYMTGKSEEHFFGEGNEITVISYFDAAYLKDDVDDIRILFTGFHDKQKAFDEANRLVAYHRQKEENKKSFVRGKDL
jgi:hypothetical protein